MKKAKKIQFLIIVLMFFSVSFFTYSCKDTNSENAFYVDINHIINYRTGMPYSVFYNVESERFENTADHIISATILSDSSMEGDSYATAICVMGVDKAISFIDKKIEEGKINGAILFTKDKKMLIFSNIVKYEQGKNFEKYKEYEIIRGEFVTESSLKDEGYKKGSYTKYDEYIFSEDISFELFLFDESLEKKDDVKSRILEKLKNLDEDINITKQNSDVSRINRANKEEKIEVSLETYTLLTESKRIYTETDGAFNIAVNPLSKLWNVDIDGIAKYRAIGNKNKWKFPNNLPSLDEIEIEKQKCDLDGLNVFIENERYYVVKSNPQVEIDLGGIAKGYAVDLATEILRENGIISSQLNISGNVYEYGDYLNPKTKKTDTWKIGVTDPSSIHDLFKGYVCAIEVTGDVSVVTSGDYERFYSYKYS